MPVGRVNDRLTPQSHRIKPPRFTTSHDVHNFLPRHITTPPEPISSRDDKSLHRTQVESESSSSSSSSINIHNYRAQGQKEWHRESKIKTTTLAKRTRTESEPRCQSWTLSFSSINTDQRVQVQKGWPLDAERLPGRSNYKKEDHWHNSENRLVGKRKMCDLNVNLDDNFECSWPSLTETSDEEDSDETSDSEAYSGPS